MPVEAISAITEKDNTIAYFPTPVAATSTGKESLAPEEQQKVDELKKRDTEVRQHEMAHLAVAGSLAKGGASYKYKVGPDGNRYAVSGEVEIDVSPVPDDPEATIAKAKTAKKAALAPAKPSSQDYAAANQADQIKREAEQQQNNSQGYNSKGQSTAAPAAAKLINQTG